MQKSIQLQSDPATAASDTALKELIQAELSLSKSDQFSYKILKRSIDARGRKIKINLSISVFINEVPKTESVQIEYKDVGKAKKTCHIIGAGPAGLFAALLASYVSPHRGAESSRNVLPPNSVGVPNSSTRCGH